MRISLRYDFFLSFFFPHPHLSSIALSIEILCAIFYISRETENIYFFSNIS